MQYHAIWRHLDHGNLCDKSFTIELMLRFVLSLQNYWCCLKLFQQLLLVQQLLLEQPCARSTLDSLGVIESENQTRLLVTGWSRMDELTFCFWLVLCLAWLSSTSTKASGLGNKSLAFWSWTKNIVELLLWDGLSTRLLVLGSWDLELGLCTWPDCRHLLICKKNIGKEIQFSCLVNHQWWYHQ